MCVFHKKMSLSRTEFNPIERTSTLTGSQSVIGPLPLTIYSILGTYHGHATQEPAGKSQEGPPGLLALLVNRPSGPSWLFPAGFGNIFIGFLCSPARNHFQPLPS